MSDASLQTQDRCIHARLARRPDFAESGHQRLRLLGVAVDEMLGRLRKMAAGSAMAAAIRERQVSAASEFIL